MNKKELLERQRQGGRNSALKRWGARFLCSVWPLGVNGLHRVVIQFKGKEHYFGGKDRLETLDRAFDFIRGQ